MWYRVEFTVPAAWVQKRVILHFGAVDWEATSYLNQKQLGVHKGGYSKFSYDITDNIRSHSGGTQELAVAVYDPTEWADGVPLGKQRYDVPGNRVRTPALVLRRLGCRAAAACAIGRPSARAPAGPPGERQLCRSWPGQRPCMHGAAVVSGMLLAPCKPGQR